MIWPVITANREYRAIAADNVLRAFKSVEFGTFDVHLNQRDSLTRQGIIEANTRHLGA
jgi:hypothetical protein